MALIDKLSAIGNAIRVKTGKTDKMTLDEMPTEIESITTSEDLNEDLTEQDTLVDELKALLQSKVAGGCDHTIETWIFTLEDGTTVEKAVVVDA